MRLSPHYIINWTVTRQLSYIAYAKKNNNNKMKISQPV